MLVLQIVNPHLLKDLTERGLWNEEMKNQLIAQNGSIQVPNIQPPSRQTLYLFLMGAGVLNIF